jgi:hypothetical protein
MSDVEFEGDLQSNSYKRIQQMQPGMGVVSSQSVMTRTLLAMGVKSENSVSRVLIVILIATIVLSGLVYYLFVRPPGPGDGPRLYTVPKMLQ